MTRRYTLLLSLFATGAVFAANTTVAELIHSGKVLEHDSVIVETPKPHEADMCRGFSLTDSQVRDFFRKAVVMADPDLHKTYQWSPCTVQGHFLYHDQKFLFTINAASTGRIETTPGTYVEFGCNVCKDIFDYGYVVPPAPATLPAPAASSAPLNQ